MKLFVLASLFLLLVGCSVNPVVSNDPIKIQTRVFIESDGEFKWYAVSLSELDSYLIYTERIYSHEVEFSVREISYFCKEDMGAGDWHDYAAAKCRENDSSLCIFFFGFEHYPFNAGYASFPWSPDQIGVCIFAHDYPHTMAHEFGHWCGLRHTFDDTPNKEVTDTLPGQDLLYGNVMNYSILRDLFATHDQVELVKTNLAGYRKGCIDERD